MDSIHDESQDALMPSTAILIANAHYARAGQLDCCLEDLAMMKALIASIGRHDHVSVAADADADAMRAQIRNAVVANGCPDELFFYFSGHGAQIGAEFYFCGTHFDASRPNETGLSHGELHEMLRSAQPDLLVKVIDACASGAPLIKAGPVTVPVRKDGLNNVIQFSSCLTDQSSFTDDPLSQFTWAFLEACLRRSDGPVYYSDVINTLRDDFLENEDQTPFFVSQGTGREILISDAGLLALFRKDFYEVVGKDDEEDGQELDIGSPPQPPTILDLLSRAERKMVTPEKADRLIASILDGVRARLARSEIGELFETKIEENAAFYDQVANDFIGRTLAREPRSDNLVTAEVRRGGLDANSSNLTAAAIAAFAMATSHAALQEEVELKLNCTLSRCEMRVVLSPKYQSLQQMVLVLSCAPSLERCYVFELLTRHQRADWNRYAATGNEVIKRWYKIDWEHDTAPLVEKICGALEEAVRSHIEATTNRLNVN